MKCYPPHHRAFRNPSPAFTLLELCLTIALIAGISSVGFFGVTKSYEAVEATKLESDVATVNSAIDLYIASGGSFDGVTTPQEIIDRLKTTRSKDSAIRFAGAPASSMIDRRVEAVPLPDSENSPGTPRAVWNISKQRFDVATIGRGGVKEFRLNEEWAERSVAVEERDPSALDFNNSDGWIWKNKNWVAHRGNLAATAVSTNPLDFGSPSPTDPIDDGSDDDSNSDDDEDDSGGSGDEDTTPPPPRLDRPVFDPPPGTYAIADFPMTVGVVNTPDPAVGNVIIQVGSGSWETYSGPVSVPANTLIRAKAISIDQEQFRDSYTTYGNYRALVDSFSGTSEGGWDQPYGGSNMVTEITNGSTSSRFAHGDTQIDLGGEVLDAGVENTITFEQASFADVAPGQRFTLGTLQMHNGTTFNDSEADGVTLSVDLDLGTYGILNFGIPFRMENTENSDDRTASADIVELLSLDTGVGVTVANLRYDLVLEIAAADENAEVQHNRFHIYEGATASGVIYGTLVPR